MSEILTIGYEGTTQDEILTRLEAAGVALLIDVRAIPQSRKPGFSKRLLSASLEARGIRYTHLRDLGTPKPGREAARRGDAAGMTRIFAAHMATAPAKTALVQGVRHRTGRIARFVARTVNRIMLPWPRAIRLWCHAEA